jgi:type III pantothenate kinase
VILAIDAGNTRIKWGVYDGGWLEQGAVAHDSLPALDQYHPSLRQAVISNVAGPEVGATILSWIAQHEIPGYWVTAQAQACGVTNGYSQPAQLGSDRWAALVAAWHLKQSACVVVSAGTALTVDALSSRGEFLGGLIVPGFAMMQQSLTANTAGVAAAGGRLVDFPLTTGDAVQSGALQAMAGAVERMQARLAVREKSKPHLLLAGGDAPVLKAALSGAGEIVDNLVLDGLVLLAGECAE